MDRQIAWQGRYSNRVVYTTGNIRDTQKDGHFKTGIPQRNIDTQVREREGNSNILIGLSIQINMNCANKD